MILTWKSRDSMPAMHSNRVQVVLNAVKSSINVVTCLNISGFITANVLVVHPVLYHVKYVKRNSKVNTNYKSICASIQVRDHFLVKFAIKISPRVVTCRIICEYIRVRNHSSARSVANVLLRKLH